MEKKFSEWLAENYSKTTTKSLKSSQKCFESLSADEDLNDMCLMELMEHMANMAENNGSPRQQIKRPIMAFYATELGNRLDITPLQAFLLAEFVDQYPDDSIETKQLAKSLGCSNLSIMSCYQDIAVLRDKKYLSERRYNKNKVVCYQIPIRVITAFQANQNVEPLDYSHMNGDQLMDELFQVISSYRSDDIDIHEAYGTTSAMVNANMQFGFCRQINEYSLSKESWILLLYVCTGFYYSPKFTMEADEFRDFFDMRCGLAQLRLFRSNKHELLTKGILEPAGGELANANEWCLSRRAANDLMSELCPVVSTNARPGVIDAENITEKSLFYPTKTALQVFELENLLSPEKFQTVQESLEAHGMRKGLACLFYGTPGTGKTETVLQIARKTGRNIMQVDMSQMRDKFVGESEKNVKQIFTRYRRLCKESEKTPILLLNEADALLGVRLTNVEHSVDQMENTMQNILLQEMENLDGILIATTNLTQNLDGAFDRRFLYKVEFLNPTPEESRHIWQAMLPEISEEDAWTLAKQYAFSGGQIENIARKQIVNSILFPEEGRDLNKIRQACDSEYLNTKQARPIGFC